jgi:shikimate dehydrogenase
VLGSNISKSISPAIQNAAFEKTSFGASYELLQIRESDFDSVIKRIQNATDVLGFNITAPYKETIIDYLSTR